VSSWSHEIGRYPVLKFPAICTKTAKDSISGIMPVIKDQITALRRHNA
jgi:hypothetical protein